MPLNAVAQDRSWEMMDELDVDDRAPVLKARPQTSPPQAPFREPAREPLLEIIGAPKASERGALRVGLSKDEVLDLIGEPDRLGSAPAGETESWSYGTSLLFFKDNELTGWSDTGELAKRAMMQRLTIGREDLQKGFKEEGWANAWERQPTVESDQVIEDLLKPP